MKISIIFFFIISFLTVICPSPRVIYCNGVRKECYKGCSKKGHSAMISCRRQCDKNYVHCRISCCAAD